MIPLLTPLERKYSISGGINMSDDWEISFNLQAAERSESFSFSVSSVKSPDKPFPSFPKEKFFRALDAHRIENKYILNKGTLKNLKFKKTSEYDDTQEIHILMLVFEKIGPVSLIFRQSFLHLTLEAIDSNYNYIGHEALLNVLVQIIKPDSPVVKGIGRIKTIYYASNDVELTKKAEYVPFLESIEGQILVFSLSIILPTAVIIVLPLTVLDSMFGYLISLGILALLWGIYPIAKRSSRHAPLAVFSVLSSYIILEILIHLKILISGINPWGIFNNISRQNLVGILQNQEFILDLGNQVGFGLEFLQIIIPFLDILLIGFIPFTIGVGSAGVIEKFDLGLGKLIFLRIFFLLLLVSSIIAIPMSYHMLGKGSEGTLHASIGLVETAEMFTPKYIENLDNEMIQMELLQLISSAQEHLLKAGNSFEQFGQNPLIAFLLPYFLPEVAGIPLVDLPDILTLTSVLGETLPYYPNILWAINNLQTGFNQTFDILMNSIQGISQEGIGSEISQEYDIDMMEALDIMQLGLVNLTVAQTPLTNLINQVQEKLDYSVFAEISDLLSTIDTGLPILITVISSSIPWINSTYKLTLSLNELFDYNFYPDMLSESKEDFELAEAIQNIDIEGIPTDSFIPVSDLVTFSQNLYEVTRHLISAVENASYMFQSLNGTLSNFQDINFSNQTNILADYWNDVENGLQNTSSFLNLTKVSLNEMSRVIESQQALEFEILPELNNFLDNLDNFTRDASTRFEVIDSYFSALNTTYLSLNHFSMGSYSLNQSVEEAMAALPTLTFNSLDATNNFTQCQILANATDDTLTGIEEHLLNESAVNNWREIIKGDIRNNSTNSIYMNAKRCLDLITQIENDVADVINIVDEFQLILDDINRIDWNIFVIEFV